MLQDLCTHGRLEYDDVLAAFDNGNGQISSNEFEASRSSAWLNAGSAGNWDWVIQPIYLYDTKKLAVGVPFPTPECNHGTSGPSEKQKDNKGGV